MKKLLVSFLSLILLATPVMADDPITEVDISKIDAENVLLLEIDFGESKGEVVIFTRPEAAPNHVARIKELIRENFYKGITFHRVIPGFMAQTGDPNGDGTGGSGKKLDAEFNAFPHVRGTLSMARNPGDENSGDSQFFIMFDRRGDLDDSYTVWGRVIRGMRIVDKIPFGEPPENPAKISNFRVAADIPNWESYWREIPR